MPLIAVDNLHKTYRLGRTDVLVLRGVSLAVRAGEFLAIVGASGSGKSTLLHLMGALDRPDPKPEGSIHFDAVPLVGAPAATLDDVRRRRVGFVFQFYHLLPELTVLENVLIGAMVALGWAYPRRSGEVRARATDLLNRVGLSHRLTHRPAELSGGERQRVAIARALINRPTLLLADEPTGNLDRKTGAGILDLFTELHRAGQTIVVVTHDEATAARADRTLRLIDGKLADEPAAAALGR